MSFAIHQSAFWLRISTLTIVMAAVSRGTGYAFSPVEWKVKLTSVGAWIAVAGLAFFRHSNRRSVAIERASKSTARGE
jgi:hypothetical protein